MPSRTVRCIRWIRKPPNSSISGRDLALLIASHRTRCMTDSWSQPINLTADNNRYKSNVVAEPILWRSPQNLDSRVVVVVVCYKAPHRPLWRMSHHWNRKASAARFLRGSEFSTTENQSFLTFTLFSKRGCIEASHGWLVSRWVSSQRGRPCPSPATLILTVNRFRCYHRANLVVHGRAPNDVSESLTCFSLFQIFICHTWYTNSILENVNFKI